MPVTHAALAGFPRPACCAFATHLASSGRQSRPRGEQGWPCSPLPGHPGRGPGTSGRSDARCALPASGDARKCLPDGDGSLGKALTSPWTWRTTMPGLRCPSIRNSARVSGDRGARIPGEPTSVPSGFAATQVIHVWRSGPARAPGRRRQTPGRMDEIIFVCGRRSCLASVRRPRRIVRVTVRPPGRRAGWAAASAWRRPCPGRPGRSTTPWSSGCRDS